MSWPADVATLRPARHARPRQLPAQLLRYLAVGISNTVLSFTAYVLGLGAGLPVVLAGSVAFALGAANGYVLNRAWTFGASDSWRARGSYVAVQLLGLTANACVLWLLVRLGAPEITAQLIALPLVTILTFGLNRSVSFRQGLGLASLADPDRGGAT
jgi:putative flippase GtrA